MASVDGEATVNDVRMISGGVFKHLTQIHFVEVSVFHALQEMRAQLKFPGPPLRPLALSQNPSCVGDLLVPFLAPRGVREDDSLASVHPSYLCWCEPILVTQPPPERLRAHDARHDDDGNRSTCSMPAGNVQKRVASAVART